MKAHYKTPDALRHDFRTVADDVRELVLATSDIADERIAKARKRLESALPNGRGLLLAAQGRARNALTNAETCVRDHPLPSIAVALGVGAALFSLFFLASRRSRGW